MVAIETPTVGKRVVHSLLECFLVDVIFRYSYGVARALFEKWLFSAAGEAPGLVENRNLTKPEILSSTEKPDAELSLISYMERAKPRETDMNIGSEILTKVVKNFYNLDESHDIILFLSHGPELFIYCYRFITEEQGTSTSLDFIFNQQLTCKL